MTPLGAGAQDWLEDETYRYTARLTRRGWAWEFLRRNAAFVGDLAVAVERVTHRELAANLSILSLPRDLLGLAKWGLRFRQLRRGGSKRLLVSSPVRSRSAGRGNLLRGRRCDQTW